MNKTIVVAAFLLIIGAARASEFGKHEEPRNILSTELPASLQAGIKTAYAGYWITGLTEEGKDKHLNYTVTLENADNVLHLRAGKDGKWEVVEAIVKE